jgi:hypothetical protein
MKFAVILTTLLTVPTLRNHLLLLLLLLLLFQEIWRALVGVQTHGESKQTKEKVKGIKCSTVARLNTMCSTPANYTSLRYRREETKMSGGVWKILRLGAEVTYAAADCYKLRAYKLWFTPFSVSTMHWTILIICAICSVYHEYKMLKI